MSYMRVATAPIGRLRSSTNDATSATINSESSPSSIETCLNTTGSAFSSMCGNSAVSTSRRPTTATRPTTLQGHPT